MLCMFCSLQTTLIIAFSCIKPIAVISCILIIDELTYSSYTHLIFHLLIPNPVSILD